MLLALGTAVPSVGLGPHEPPCEEYTFWDLVGGSGAYSKELF